MSIIGLIIVLIIVGALLQLIPMQPQIKNIIYILIVVLVAVMLLSWFGIFNFGSGSPRITVP